MSVRIPEDFLRKAPPNASLRKIDFMHTTPPIPAFNNHFAAIVDNFMTETECKELLHLATESASSSSPDSQSPTTTATTPWDRAMINAGNGKEVMSTDMRKSGRILWDSPDLAQRVQDRLMPFLRECGIDEIHNQPIVTGLGPAKRGEVFRLTRLNERIRFLRYQGGEYFRPHWDGCYVTPDGGERSLYTIHLYLNGDGEQDMQELEREMERVERREYLHAQQDGEVDIAELVDDEAEERNQSNGSSDGEEEEETLLGGATSFMHGYFSKDVVRVFPRTGSVLIFQQRNLFHSGDDVFRGVKYTMRTDIMYRKETKTN